MEPNHPSVGTLGADALDNVAGGGDGEAGRHSNAGHGNAVETEGALAALAEEMDMEVVVLLATVAVAQLVAQCPCPVFDDMGQMMVAEKGEGTEDARLVDGQDLQLQLGQRQRPGRQGQLAQHYNAVGRGLDAMLSEQADAFFLFHGSRFLRITAAKLLIIFHNLSTLT